MRSLFSCLAGLVLLPWAALSRAEDAAPPRALACLSRWYAVEPVREGDAWRVRVGGVLYPWDDGRAKSFEQKLAAPDLEDTFSQPYTPGPIAPVTRENEDPGRIRFDPLFRATYGDAPERVALVELDLLGQRLRVHRRVAPAFQRVAARLERLVAETPALRAYLTPLGGTFVWRNIARTQRLSAHAYGVSLDVNVARSDYWAWAPAGAPVRWKNRIPPAIVEAFEAEGFIWGGRWYHFDTMHFEYRPELLDAACREDAQGV